MSVPFANTRANRNVRSTTSQPLIEKPASRRTGCAGVEMILAIVASWSIAFIEYCFAVPANRIGHSVYSAAELKTMQEIITLMVFACFSVLYLGEKISWNHLVGFALIAGGAYFIFHKW